MLRSGLRWLLAALMVLAGVMHFVKPEPFLAIMPDYLPWHLALVLISGVFEILGGVGLLIPRTRVAAGWGLIALFVAVFPANVWMATEGIQPEGLELSPTMAWARLPLQLVLIALAWWVSRPDVAPGLTSDARDPA
ncbi:DoxX family protein [Nannocystaceae bacterium ST9]